MNFTLKQLRYFDAALRSGSIARAAAEMNISQSSITAAIDLIKQTLDVDLFRRIPAKGIVATQLGQDIGSRVSGFLEQARLFESDLMSLAGDPTGTLRLACYAPTAPYVLPPLLKRIAEEYPDIRIELQEGNMQSISDMLSEGVVDVALTYRRHAPDGERFVPLFRARPWVLLPENSPLADLPMVLLDLPGTETYFKGLFEARGLSPNVVHSTKSSSVLRGLVAAQFGFSILNICGPNDRDGRAGYVTLPLDGEVDAPLFGVAYAAAVQQSVIVQAVVATSVALTEAGELDHLLLDRMDETPTE